MDHDDCSVNNDLKWLMERSHNAYLSYIALWLAGMIGLVSILVTLTQRQEIFASPALIDQNIRIGLLTWIVYWGLVWGMIFSVYRLGNIIREYQSWGRQIRREFLRKEIAAHRGILSKLIVDQNARICEPNRIIVYFVHILFASFFLQLATSFPAVWIMIVGLIVAWVSSIPDLVVTLREKKRRKLLMSILIGILMSFLLFVALYFVQVLQLAS